MGLIFFKSIICRQRDDTGNTMTHWWSDFTLSRYLDKAQCFIDQYNNYIDPKTQQKVNGVTTLDEYIADSVGLHLSLLAHSLNLADDVKEPFFAGLDHRFGSLTQYFNANFRCGTKTDEYLQQENPYCSSRFRVTAHFQTTMILFVHSIVRFGAP